MGVISARQNGPRRIALKTKENRRHPGNPCKIIALHMQLDRSCTATKFILQRTIGSYIGSIDSGVAGEGTEQCC
jgi:hypothetical protein